MERRELVLAAAARRRVALADLLDELRPAELEAASLCSGWSCRVVAGHLYAAQTYPARTFVLALLAAGLRPDRVNERLSRRAAALPITEISRRFRDDAEGVISVPIVGVNGPLADLLIHYADIAVPLARPFNPDPADVALAMDFLTGARAPGFVAKGTLAGLRLSASDVTQSWGSGPADQEVRGRAADIMLAITGRSVVLDQLDGGGVALLRRRLR